MPESSGLSIYRNLDANATGANIKASTGKIKGWHLYNNATAARYIKFYDKATAPVVGTDTPALTVPLPASSSVSVSFRDGIDFANGIGIGATNAIADNSTAAPTANDVVVNVFYR